MGLEIKHNSKWLFGHLYVNPIRTSNLHFVIYPQIKQTYSRSCEHSSTKKMQLTICSSNNLGQFKPNRSCLLFHLDLEDWIGFWRCTAHRKTGQRIAWLAQCVLSHGESCQTDAAHSIFHASRFSPHWWIPRDLHSVSSQIVLNHVKCLIDEE